MKLNVRNDSIDFGTNILTVTVPDALRNKVKSGLEYVDGALGGEGFTPARWSSSPAPRAPARPR